MCIHTRGRRDRHAYVTRVAPPGKEQMGPGHAYLLVHVSARAGSRTGASHHVGRPDMTPSRRWVAIGGAIYITNH